MSTIAPWLALAADWHESEMLAEANNGERLAWIFLLCLAKTQGRAGRVKLRNKAFAQTYRLSVEAVDGMIAKARHAGAVTVDDEGVVTIVNWSRYQDPRRRTSGDDNHKPAKQLDENDTHFTKTSATRDQRPETHQRSPITKSPETGTPDSGSSGRLKKVSFVNLDMAVLRSLPLFRTWITQEKRRKDAWIRSIDDEQFALAAREKAISDTTLDNPVAWFTATMPLKQTDPNEAWSRIRGKHEDAAKQSQRGERKHHYSELVEGIGRAAE